MYMEGAVAFYLIAWSSNNILCYNILCYTILYYIVTCVHYKILHYIRSSTFWSVGFRMLENAPPEQESAAGADRDMFECACQLYVFHSQELYVFRAVFAWIGSLRESPQYSATLALSFCQKRNGSLRNYPRNFPRRGCHPVGARRRRRALLAEAAEDAEQNTS